MGGAREIEMMRELRGDLMHRRGEREDEGEGEVLLDWLQVLVLIFFYF